MAYFKNVVMSYYNGTVEYRFSVLIQTKTHDATLYISKFFKHYLDAWTYGIDLKDEYKSARKGVVLKRELMARFTAHSSDVIAFREGLRCLVNRYKHPSNFDDPPKAILIDHSMRPEDADSNLFS